MSRILYLGIDPIRYPRAVVHCPIIQTVARVVDEETKKRWPSFTHVLFTSPSAVKHWPLPLLGKEILAIGSATASVLAVPCRLAPVATQEGMVALIQTLPNVSIFWPRSSRARSLLDPYCHSFDLYDTCLKRPDLLPNLDDFDEIVFTSPSTVEAFLELYDSIPWGKIITPIGPITNNCLMCYNRHFKKSGAPYV